VTDVTDATVAGMERIGATALRRAAAMIVLSLVAGGFVFAIEAFDRLRVLRVNYDGVGEAAQLALLIGATVLAVALVASIAGVAVVGAEALRSAVTARLPERVGRFRAVAGLVVSAAIVTVVIRLVSAAVPWALEGPVYRLIRRIDNRLTSLGPIADHPKIVFALALSTATLAVMALVWWLFADPPRRRVPGSLLVAVVAVALTMAGFAADSRIEFTRYEFMFHIPLEVIYSLTALLACIAAARCAGRPEHIALTRRVVALGLVAGALGVGSVVYGGLRMDANQNVKALFWGRSIVSRRVFQAMRQAMDRDGDGFSRSFGGGDLDDANAAVHPMVAEVPANGIDDNCIGGDLASSEYAPGALYVPSTPQIIGPPTAPPAPGTRNILILSVDCLRADHLSCYGYRKQTSPNIDRFAAESLLFENTYAQGTNTGHSFTSMYRSSYGDDIFDDRIPTFARIASDRGYTSEFVNSIRTDAWLNANRWGKYKELLDDFEMRHDDGDRFWNAEELTNQAIAVLDAQAPGQSHLTWVHYFDCHRPRRRHAEHEFGRSAAGIFDSNVAFVDEHIGRLLDHLRQTGALDRTIVFLIADHGEAFMEHGAQDHSNKPYNNNTLVPLIVHAPGTTPARIAAPCGLIDVGPTALAYAGIAVPAWYRGVDLIGALGSGGVPRRTIVSETPRNLIESSFYTWALVDWPYKVMWDVRSNTTEVYDIENDPGEMHNLAARDPQLAQRMRQTLGEWLDRETARTGAIGPGDEGIPDVDGD